MHNRNYYKLLYVKRVRALRIVFIDVKKDLV